MVCPDVGIHVIVTLSGEPPSNASSETLGTMARQPTKPTQKRAEQPMEQAPRDRTLVELIPKRGKPFIGYFDPTHDGWADWGDLVPLIRPDPDFVGWRPRTSKKGSPKKAL
jgi:hypothetical protein